MFWIRPLCLNFGLRNRMRSFILTIILVLASFAGAKAQSLSDLKMTLPSMEERFGMDYDVEGLYQPTAEMLAGLDLTQYEELRKVDEDVKFFDNATGYMVHLYSINKAIENYTYRFKKQEEDE